MCSLQEPAVPLPDTHPGETRSCAHTKTWTGDLEVHTRAQKRCTTSRIHVPDSIAILCSSTQKGTWVWCRCIDSRGGFHACVPGEELNTEDSKYNQPENAKLRLPPIVETKIGRCQGPGVSAAGKQNLLRWGRGSVTAIQLWSRTQVQQVYLTRVNSTAPESQFNEKSVI